MIAKLLFPSLFAFAVLFSSVGVQAQEWSPPGPEVGTQFPDVLSAQDQNSRTRSLPELLGKRGVVVVFVRSADWCPYCMRQLIELQQRATQFEALGFPVVTVSVDSVALVKKFADAQKITYTMLADPAGDLNKRLGIRDENYPVGSKAFGVPQPGIFVLDSDLKIIGKYFVQGYRERPNLDLIINELRGMTSSLR